MYPPDIFRHTVSRLVAILHGHGVRFHLRSARYFIGLGEDIGEQVTESQDRGEAVEFGAMPP